MTKRRLAVLAASLAVVLGVGAACSEDAAVDLATDVAQDLGADPSCVAGVEAMVRASVDVSDEVADGQDDDLASIIEALDAFVAAAPEELRPQVRALFDGYVAVAQAHDAGDPDAQAAAEAFLETPEAEAASAAIGDWFDDHCTPGSGSSTSTTARLR